MSVPTIPSIHVPPEPREPENERPRVSRRRLFVIAGGLLLGTVGTFKLMQGFGGFRVNQVEASTPAFDPATFRLTIDGAVARTLSLSMDDVRALPAVSQVSDFHCVDGWGVNDMRWRGVRLQTIIDMVQPQNAGFITFHSLDGVYKDSLSLVQATLPDVLLAYELNDAPLSPRHGLPLRLIAPHMYGYKGPKWLTRVEFAADQVTGYWEERGWALDGWIH
jgi:DMSO/TMAO reductase YedYZ molybdopterin-dependent catalytic subunit